MVTTLSGHPVENLGEVIMSLPRLTIASIPPARLPKPRIGLADVRHDNRNRVISLTSFCAKHYFFGQFLSGKMSLSQPCFLCIAFIQIIEIWHGGFSLNPDQKYPKNN